MSSEPEGIHEASSQKDNGPPVAPRILNTMLDNLRKRDQVAALFLTNGIRITGRVKEFDHESILIIGPNDVPSVVQRSALSTVQKNMPKDKEAQK
jgi:sRNA-binding regulator protein Hfq